MSRRGFAVYILAFAWLFAAQAVRAVDPFADWYTLETQHFFIHFDKPHRQDAERVARIAESVHQRLSPLLNWQPRQKTHLVLSDEADFANGYATPLNINRSVLFMSPPRGVGGLEEFDDWLELLITHEYVHVLHLDKASGDPATFRKVFGRFFLTFPNSFQPAWLIEGLATFYETDAERGIGRGQATLFASLMRMEVERGILPVEQVNLPFTTWPAGASRYLYGVYFYRFLHEVYGEDSVQKLVEEYSSHLIPFSINAGFRTALGDDVRGVWQRFGQWLRAHFEHQSDEIRKQGIVEGERITHSAYFTGPVRVQGDTLYYIENNGAQQPRLMKVQHGETTGLTEVTRADFDVNSRGDVLISQSEVCNEYRLYKDLYLYDAASEQLRRLSECGRYVQARWFHHRDSLLALQHNAGRYSLVELDTQAGLRRLIQAFDAQVIVGGFDVSPDDRLIVAALWKPGKGWDLYLYDFASERWQALTDDRRVQAYPEFTPDGKSILYSAESGHAYNLFRYDLHGGVHTQLSNVPGGAFQVSSNGEWIYYIGLHSGGTDVYRLPADVWPVASADADEHNAGSAVAVRQHPQVDTEVAAYNPLPSLIPRWWFPLLALTEDSIELGLTTAGNDALGVHNYVASAAALTMEESEDLFPMGQLSYSFSNLFGVSFRRELSLFRDNNGVLNRLRHDDALQLTLALPDTRVLSASAWLLGVSRQRNADTALFNNAVPLAAIEDNLLGLAWRYDSSRRYPLSISRNDGRRIRLVAEDGSALSGDFDGQVLTASWREYIPLGGEHVLALRALQGKGRGLSRDFRLGGEDTGVRFDRLLNASGGALFGRREYALRGYAEGLPQLRGQNARLISAEWRFPGQRIERGIMAPPLGIMQWSGALFAEAGAAYDGNSPDRYYRSAGLEFNADLNLFYLVPVRARLGIAHGFDEAIGGTRAYVSLGSSF